MPSAKRWLTLCVAGAAVALCVPATAGAQTQTKRAKWTVELYAGSTWIVGSQGGSADAGFPAGPVFTTTTGRPSRAVPSWFFGDGAALLNEALGQFAATGGTTFPRIVPLDAALGSGGSAQSGGAAFGVRLGRDLTDRLSVELSVDRRVSSLAFSSGMTDALGATRDSFKSAFDSLLATVPATNVSVTSTLSTSNPSGSQMQYGAAFNWKASGRGRLGVHLTAGGGALTSGGDSEATLTGVYSFRLLSAFTIAETDRAVVKITPGKTAGVALAGGGLTWALSRGVALKADVRASFVAARATTTVRGTPSSAPQSPTAVLPSLTTPSIQFSSQQGIATSLSGVSSEVTTFRSTGWARQVAATIAIVRRF